MAISLYLRNEGREFVRKADCSYWPWNGSYDRERFPMLGAVDPYGDAVFNARQMEKIVGEVDQLFQEDLSERQRKSLEAVIELCHYARLHPRLYLWFFGD